MTAKPATAEIVRQIGHALYGSPPDGSVRDSRWMTALGRAIGRSRLTVRRWARGEGEPNAGDWGAMCGVLGVREAEIRRLGALAWKRSAKAGELRP